MISIDNEFLLIAAGHESKVKSDNAYDAALDYVNDHKGFYGMIEVIAPERCFMFMVLRDGNVVNYEG
jgi:hypothetical protein